MPTDTLGEAGQLGEQMAVSQDHGLAQQVGATSIVRRSVTMPQVPQQRLCRLTTWQFLKPASSALGMWLRSRREARKIPEFVRAGIPLFSKSKCVPMRPTVSIWPAISLITISMVEDNDGAASEARYSHRIGAVTGSRHFRRW